MRRAFQHPSERGFDFPQPGASQSPAASRLIESSTRCHLFGIGESKSTSSTTDSRSVADNAAELTNITGASKSNVAADGSTQIQGSNVAGLITDADVGGNLTINDTGGEILTLALDKFSEFAALAEQGRQNATTDTGEKLTELLDAVTAAKAAADPEARKDNTILYLGLALILGAAAWLIMRKV